VFKWLWAGTLSWAQFDVEDFLFHDLSEGGTVGIMGRFRSSTIRSSKRSSASSLISRGPAADHDRVCSLRFFVADFDVERGEGGLGVPGDSFECVVGFA